MKDMSSIYFQMPTFNLLVLRSKKKVEIQKLENSGLSYFAKRDLARLRQQVIWINAVIDSRDAQVALFL